MALIEPEPRDRGELEPAENAKNLHQGLPVVRSQEFQHWGDVDPRDPSEVEPAEQLSNGNR
jgi:hypothetical protein